MLDPKLRNVDKVKPRYPLGVFPSGTVLSVAKQIIYLVHTRGEARLEGPDWEKMFANAICAEWAPSNVGLDDIRLGCCCWGAKTVKQKIPSETKTVRLISGRCSLDYSFAVSDVRSVPPDEIGQMVLSIYRERVSSVRQRFSHCRTIVLMKSADLRECAMFETETVRYDQELYEWQWNKRGNLQGHDKSGRHKFTWQPHGSQFTIIDDVPSNRVAFRLRLAPPMTLESVMASIGFDASTWFELL